MVFRTISFHVSHLSGNTVEVVRTAKLSPSSDQAEVEACYRVDLSQDSLLYLVVDDQNKCYSSVYRKMNRNSYAITRQLVSVVSKLRLSLVNELE